MKFDTNAQYVGPNGELIAGHQLPALLATSGISGLGETGLGRNIFQTLGHKLTGTNLGRGLLAAGATVGGVKLAQHYGALPQGSVVDLARLLPGIVENQVTRAGRAIQSVLQPAVEPVVAGTAAGVAAGAATAGRKGPTPAPVPTTTKTLPTAISKGPALPLMLAAGLGALLLLH